MIPRYPPNDFWLVIGEGYYRNESIRKGHLMKTLMEKQIAESAEADRRLTAIHEAGHACVHFALEVKGFRAIYLATEAQFSADNDNGNGSDNPLGFVIHWDDYPLCFPPLRPGKYCRKNLLELCSYDCLVSFGGPCAEYLLGKQDSNRLEWFDEGMDYVLENPDVWRDDFVRASRLSKEAYTSEWRRSQFLMQIALWTEELVSDPGMQSVILDLAESLLQSEKSTMNHSESWTIMESGLAGSKSGFDKSVWQDRFPNIRTLLPY